MPAKELCKSALFFDGVPQFGERVRRVAGTITDKFQHEMPTVGGLDADDVLEIFVLVRFVQKNRRFPDRFRKAEARKRRVEFAKRVPLFHTLLLFRPRRGGIRFPQYSTAHERL